MAASLSGMTLPSWASHLRHRLAPPPLLLVQAFVNTRDLDLHTDVLAQAGEARAWLADGLAGLLLTIRDAQADGSWDRMKLCGNPDCRWAFYDRSHSRQGAWCDMASCGNRLKNRSLRARRAQAG